MKRLLFFPFLLLGSLLFGQIQVATVTNEIPASGGVIIDAEGNVYIANYGDGLQNSNGSQIWKYEAGGNLSLYASGFSGASGNAFDSQGNIFQANISSGQISKVAPDGSVSVFASSGISCPVGINIDSEDNLYVCNCCGTFGNTIRKVSPNGLSTLFTASNLLNCPNGITRDGANNLYVSNFNNGNVIKIDPNGNASVFATIPGNNNGHITYSSSLDQLIVASHGSSRIYGIMPSGEVYVLAGSGIRGNDDGEGATATFSRPNGLAVTASGDTIYVNSSIPTSNVGFPLNPSVLRQITGVNPSLGPPVEPDTDKIRLQLNPNPSSGPIELDFKIPDRTELIFLIYNYQGQIVHRIDAGIFPAGAHQLNIQPQLPVGVYECTMLLKDSQVSRRFLVH